MFYIILRDYLISSPYFGLKKVCILNPAVVAEWAIESIKIEEGLLKRSQAQIRNVVYMVINFQLKSLYTTLYEIGINTSHLSMSSFNRPVFGEK